MSQFTEFFQKLFDVSDWPPRWHCGRWTDFHGWLYIISDLLIWSAYFAIPTLIFRYVTTRKQKVRFNTVYILFAFFILACGTTHFLDAMMFWVPMYRVGALVRLATGVLSWLTVYHLLKMLPTAFSLRSAEDLEQEVELRKKAEQALKQQNRLLNESQQMAKVGSWEWDVRQDQVTWSDEEYRIWGLPAGEALTYEKYLRYIHPADRDYVTAHITRALETRSFPPFYHRILTPQGTVKHILARGEIEVDASGEPVRLSGTSQDVTQLKQGEFELLAKSMQLERKNQELEQFAYIASHDLQEPLRKITTFSAMLQRGLSVPLEEKEQMYLDKIVHSAGRMQRLISDILNFSRLSDNTASFQDTNLAFVLREVLTDMELLISGSGAQVHADALMHIEGIPGQLRQLFQNLISNALKFRREGVPPEVSVTTRTLHGRDLGPVLQSFIIQNNPSITPEVVAAIPLAEIRVQDNGIGFDQAYADKIFHIFQRLHGRSEYEGTGIGLAICKRIVENHHGAIMAESHPGTGAVFTVILPLSQQPFNN